MFIDFKPLLGLQKTNDFFKTAAVLALTETRAEDKAELTKLLSTIKEGYTDKYEESRRHWGGGILGAKSVARTEKKRKALEASIKV